MKAGYFMKMLISKYENRGKNSIENNIEVINTTINELSKGKFPEKTIIEVKINGITNLFVNAFYQSMVNFSDKFENDCYYFTHENTVYYFKPILKIS